MKLKYLAVLTILTATAVIVFNSRTKLPTDTPQPAMTSHEEKVAVDLAASAQKFAEAGNHAAALPLTDSRTFHF